MGLALTEALGQPIRPVSRPASSAPATGSTHAHDNEQRALVERAFSSG
jgi:2-oxoglutarate dehydrogenase complex dehydrogenase (E1) component-like enzyme